MHLEMRDPGASSQATGAILGGSYNSKVANPTSLVNIKELIRAAFAVAAKGKPVFAVNIKKAPLTRSGFKDVNRHGIMTHLTQ